jgi:2-polyprenyl-3-methyl-5-hydroxy-6-metoxy-1,4-benzoquinol methylase
MNETAYPHLEVIPCNLCGGDEYRVLFNSPYRADINALAADFVASTDRFDRYGQIVRCRRCGLVYTNPRPMMQDLLRGYEKTTDVEYTQEDSSRSINAHMNLRTIKKFVPRGRLLDVGCNTGYFLNAARLDFDAHGIEPSQWAVRYAVEHLKLNVRQGSLEDAGLDEGSFDVVTLIDVLEHMTDPLGAVRRVASLLKPKGLAYFVTPDIKSLTSRLLRGRWWGLRPAHIHYYSHKTLAALLDKAGFDVLLAKSYGRIFTYGYWVSRLRNYPFLFRWPVETAVRALRLEDKLLYLDTRDTMEVCARKRDVSA